MNKHLKYTNAQNVLKTILFIATIVLLPKFLITFCTFIYFKRLFLFVF
jgi:hypothetical protein